MSFRPERRRRLMADDGSSHAPADDGKLPLRGGGPQRDDQTAPCAFGPAAETALRRPIGDLIPTSYAAVALAVVGGLLTLGAIVGAHFGAARVDRLFGAEGAGVFDLAAPANASHPLAAALMGAAGFLAAFIYSLRRHRVDDYYGRYRVWIWTAVACGLVGLGETTNLAALFRGLSDRAAAACGIRATVVWPSALGAVLALAGLRLLVEVRRSRGTVALAVLAMALFALAAAIELGWVSQVPEPHRLLVERTCWLAGYMVVLAAFMSYAHRVALEIEGKIAVVPTKLKPPKPRRLKKAHHHPDAKETKEKAAPKRTTAARTDLDPVPEGPAEQPRAPREKSPEAAAPRGVDRPDRPLSKKERRRLRREARRQNQNDSLQHAEG